MILRRAAAAFVAAVACFACGGSATSPVDVPPPTLLRLDDVAPAVAAVEEALGGPQKYTEINVGPDLVNLFVVVDESTELAYVYRDGKLEDPGAPMPRPAESAAFALDNVDLSKVTGFDELLAKELPDSQMTRLGLLDAPPAALGWRVLLTSSKGGTFEVILSPSGSIVGGQLN